MKLVKSNLAACASRDIMKRRGWSSDPRPRLNPTVSEAMTDPASDHSVVPFPLHPPEMEPPGRRLVERALEGDALRKMLDELNRESRAEPRPESLAWAFLGLLEDPQYRPKFRSIFHVPDDFGGDDSSRRVGEESISTFRVPLSVSAVSDCARVGGWRGTSRFHPPP